MNKTIQTKRNKPSGSNYRVLYAKTGRKRRLNASVATATPESFDIESEVPNIGIGRALLVILVLHVIAIGAIYVHSTFFSQESEAVASSGNSGKTPAAAAVATEAPRDEAKPAVAQVAPPKHIQETTELDTSSTHYLVVTGDSYARIAAARNVDENALRALNGNRLLRAGYVIDLPAELSSRPVAVREERAERPSPAVLEEPKQQPRARTFRAVERNSGPDVSRAPKAIVVKPAIKRPVAPSVRASGRTYTVKSGDTLWRISRRYKVSTTSILKLNGMKDANRLRVGAKIKIPRK